MGAQIHCEYSLFHVHWAGKVQVSRSPVCGAGCTPPGFQSGFGIETQPASTTKKRRTSQNTSRVMRPPSLTGLNFAAKTTGGSKINYTTTYGNLSSHRAVAHIPVLLCADGSPL